MANQIEIQNLVETTIYKGIQCYTGFCFWIKILTEDQIEKKLEDEMETTRVWRHT